MFRGLVITAALAVCPMTARAQTILFSLPYEGLPAAAGDINQDGFDDILVANVSSETVRVLSGRDGSVLLILPGGGPGEWFGRSVASVGDLNNDAVPDVAVGNPSFGGSVTVFSGADGAILLSLNGDMGFGSVVAGPGDIDADGSPDVLVGAYGYARALSGMDGHELYTFTGTGGTDDFGYSVAGAGFVNFDGYADIVVGAPQYYTYPHHTGYAQVFSGRDGQLLYTFAGDQDHDGFGISVDGVQDVNLDGYGDVIVGGTGYAFPPVPGRTSVFSGRDGGRLLDFQQASPVVSRAGDVNGDGQPDFYMGSNLVSSKDGSILYSYETVPRFGGDINGDGVPDAISTSLAYSGMDCPANWSNYGSGWPGTNGVPAFFAWANPVICSTTKLDLSNSRGSNTIAAIFIGLSEAAVPTAWDGTLLLVPSWIVTVAFPISGVAIPVTIPCDSSLCGFPVYLQALEVDPGASKGISFTQGLKLVLGGVEEG